jgi:hypothetical protein
MDISRALMLVALLLFLAEGLTLSFFPVQFQRLLVELEPRALQAAGLVETLLALGLMTAIALG